MLRELLHAQVLGLDGKTDAELRYLVLVLQPLTVLLHVLVLE